MLCPCCKGKGQIEEGPPVVLTPTQTKIYNAVRAAKHGIDTSTLADRVYADRIDGGPVSWKDAICTQIWTANKRLEAAGQKIVSRGLVYMLVT